MASDADCPRDHIDPADVRTLANSLSWDEIGGASVDAKAHRMAERIERGEPMAVEMDVIEALLLLARCGTESCWMRSLDTERPQCECGVCAAYRRLDAWAERHPFINAEDIDRLCLWVEGRGSQEIVASARQIADAMRDGEVTNKDVNTKVMRGLAEVAVCRRLGITCVQAAKLRGECLCSTCASYRRVMRWLKGMETMP